MNFFINSVRITMTPPFSRIDKIITFFIIFVYLFFYFFNETEIFLQKKTILNNFTILYHLLNF